MIYDMGLQHLLHGVTFECPAPALKEKLRVVRYLLEGNVYTSIEIDRIFSASKAEGKSLYYVDDAVLQQIEPDSPAARAGLLPGDVVIRLDGVEVNGVDDLIRILDRDRIGRRLQMDVLRMGRLREIDIDPVERRPAVRQG